MAAIKTQGDDLRRQWRQQILAHRSPRSVAARKGFVAMTIVDESHSSSEFVDIGNVLVTALYKDGFGSDEQGSSGRVPLRLTSYDVSRVPHGVQWGGPTNSRLFKDLMLTPRHDARGQRFDPSKVELISLALKLNCRLNRAVRHPAAPRAELRLPNLWAGFRSREIGTVRGDGPEFERVCGGSSVAANALFLNSTWHVDGLTLYPLEWVSSQLKLAVAVFAQLIPRMQHQVFRIAALPQGLIGYQGASAFDFFGSRFRRRPSSDPTSNGPYK